MKYVDEYRNSKVAAALAKRIGEVASRPWVLMEICGGQTHSIVRYGIDRILPREVELVHGPGCPVCVTPLETIDRAHAIAREPDVIFTSFGDMLRVPGSATDLLQLRSRGADVRIVYAPTDAVAIARENPDKRVVFFGIGFETTAPANALAVSQARRLGVANFSMLVSHVRVPPAIDAILDARDNRVQGFLGPGHVCAVVGTEEYEELTARHHVPIVIAGFEPIDLLEGILMTVQQLEEGRAETENQYKRTVKREGNAGARRLVDEVFEVSDRKWRGIGLIPRSGLRLREEYRAHDAEALFDVQAITTAESTACISGLVLRGLKKPSDCPAFGKTCRPEQPLGATMVSAEGACAAYWQYGRRPDLEVAPGGEHA
ncbi:MAG: hydrogenase formation protein HypD [Labilithrix sp.]|nr:hydrogenase formation protein HypD [Labilithrix sp.]MCW5815658.1 hydrogenase formation protein HypD [Labilithrix sp.]